MIAKQNTQHVLTSVFITVACNILRFLCLIDRRFLLSAQDYCNWCEDCLCKHQRFDGGNSFLKLLG